MIEAIRGLQGQSQALCKCRDCAAEVVVAAAHGDSGSFSRTGAGRNGFKAMSVANEGQVITKVQGLGWSFIKNRLRCPKCEADRKSDKQEKPMATVTELRTPTREQKRQIMDILGEVYDAKAGRYKGAETDVTVADTIGGGVMFGWVAELRIEFFGESGENEEAEDFLGQIAEWRDKADAIAADVQVKLADMNAARAKVADIENRMKAFVKAMGPKAVRA